MITQELLNILVCPETKQRVVPAKEGVLAELNAKIANGQLRNRAGGQVQEKLDGALVREDGKFAYPVRKDIPVMLLDESLPL